MFGGTFLRAATRCSHCYCGILKLLGVIHHVALSQVEMDPLMSVTESNYLLAKERLFFSVHVDILTTRHFLRVGGMILEHGNVEVDII